MTTMILEECCGLCLINRIGLKVNARIVEDAGSGIDMRFKKKPVVIEAEQFYAYTLGFPPREFNNYLGGDLHNWLVSKGYVYGKDFWMDEEPASGKAFMVIHTLEGDHRADVGDWIIRGVKDEIYPCKPDIFKMTYESVQDDA